MTIRIITDSASDILPDEYEDVTVLPLSVAFGETIYRDGVDLAHHEFYNLLIETDHLPICTIGATIGTHVGPGAIAVAFFTQGNRTSLHDMM